MDPLDMQHRNIGICLIFWNLTEERGLWNEADVKQSVLDNILNIWKTNYRHVMIWRFPVPPKHIENDWNILKPWRHRTLNLFVVPSRWLARQCPKRQRSRWQKHDAVTWRRVVYKNSTIWISFRCIETLQGWNSDDYGAVTIAGMS